jgi:cytochrome b561
MRARNSAQSWGWVARLIHWIMAALILFQLGFGVWMANFVSDMIRQFQLTQFHKSWGVVIFALALLRIGWRLANRAAPTLPPATPGWQHRAARASHTLLYALMMILPLSGWVMSAASPVQDLLNIENMVFGLLALPDPWKPGVEAIADAANTVHVAAAIALVLILAIHAAAALKHHFIDRDDVLARMTWGR